MNRRSRFVFFAWTLLFFSFAWAKDREIVILLSLDGSRPDYFTQSTSPNIVRMGQNGWHGSLTSVFPSESFPNHATLITGCATDAHGIVSNKFTDPVRGVFEYSMDPSWMTCQPIWVAMQEAGLKTAVTTWPLHGAGSWKQQTPTYENKLETTDIKTIIHFDDAKKVEQIETWLSMPSDTRPQFIFSWFANIDTAGHAHGPFSKEVQSAVTAYDTLLGSLLRFIDQMPDRDTVNVVIVSDHGMAQMKRAANLHTIRKELDQSGIDDGSYTIQNSGTNAWVYLQRTENIKSSAIFKKLKEIGRRSGAYETMTQRDLPKRYLHENPRSGDILLIGSEGYYFVDSPDFSALVTEVSQPIGKHGYDPRNKAMKAAFFASGPSFPRKKKSVSMHMTDIAPKILRALEVK